jgi:uncharacterized membrane protein
VAVRAPVAIRAVVVVIVIVVLVVIRVVHLCAGIVLFACLRAARRSYPNCRTCFDATWPSSSRPCAHRPCEHPRQTSGWWLFAWASLPPDLQRATLGWCW